MPNKPKPQKRPWVPERAANDKMQKRDGLNLARPSGRLTRFVKFARAKGS